MKFVQASMIHSYSLWKEDCNVEAAKVLRPKMLPARFGRLLQVFRCLTSCSRRPGSGQMHPELRFALKQDLGRYRAAARDRQTKVRPEMSELGRRSFCAQDIGVLYIWKHPIQPHPHLNATNPSHLFVSDASCGHSRAWLAWSWAAGLFGTCLCF